MECFFLSFLNILNFLNNRAFVWLDEAYLQGKGLRNRNGMDFYIEFYKFVSDELIFFFLHTLKYLFLRQF